jgi:hypothetical protein
MLAEWDAELEARSRAFAAHAAALSRWDAHILDSRRALLSVEEELCKARPPPLGRPSWLCPALRRHPHHLLELPSGCAVPLDYTPIIC